MDFLGCDDIQFDPSEVTHFIPSHRWVGGGFWNAILSSMTTEICTNTSAAPTYPCGKSQYFCPMLWWLLFMGKKILQKENTMNTMLKLETGKLTSINVESVLK